MIARGRIWSERITGRKPVAPPRMTAEADAHPAAAEADEPVVVSPRPESLKQPAPS
jgi:hypothetical protein